jgi:hypothetical protein
MKGSILEFTMTVPLPLLLSLILIFSFSSCSKPSLSDIVREHIKAVNNDDVKKNLTFFTEDVVFITDFPRTLTGKDQLRDLMEWDVVKKTRLTINDIKVEGTTVIAKLIEKNEADRLVRIEEYPFIAVFKFRGRLIEKVKLESLPVAKLLDKKYKSFDEWVSKEHPQESSRMEKDRPSAEKARLFLSLLKEWRDRTQK